MAKNNKRLIIFNPNTVKDQASFVKPSQPPVGIEDVFVNGELVVEKGLQRSVLPGRVLNSNR